MPRKSQRVKTGNSGTKSIEKPKRNPVRKRASKTKAVEEEPEMILGDLNDSDSGTSSDSSTWSEFGERILTRGIGTGNGAVSEESSDEGDLDESKEPVKKRAKTNLPSSIVQNTEIKQESDDDGSTSTPPHLHRGQSLPQRSLNESYKINSVNSNEILPKNSFLSFRCKVPGCPASFNSLRDLGLHQKLLHPPPPPKKKTNLASKAQRIIIIQRKSPMGSNLNQKYAISSILPPSRATKSSKSPIPPSTANLQGPPSPPINPTHVKEEPLDVKPDLGPSNDPEEPFQIDPISLPSISGPSPPISIQIKVEKEPLEENTIPKTPKVPPQTHPNSKSENPELLTFTQKLEREVDMHISEDGVCKSCLATFNEPNVLRWHVQMTHTKFRSCPFIGCIAGVVAPRIIKSHLKMHEQSPPPLQFNCTFPGCSFTSNVWIYLLHHEKDAHFSYCTDITQTSVPTTKPQFTCKYQDCSKTYEKEDSLRSHIRRDHYAKKPKESKICEKCGQIRRNHKSFKLHLMKCNNPKLPNIYTCNFQGCGKEFKTINNWKLHLDAHQGIYKFLCEFCGIGYPSKAHYENHRVWAHLDLLPLEEKEANEAKLVKLKESKAKHKENFRKKREALREKETEEERQKRREGYKELRIKYFEKNGEKLKEYYRNYQKGYLKRKMKTEEEKKALFAKRNEYQRQRWARMSLEERRRKNSKKTLKG